MPLKHGFHSRELRLSDAHIGGLAGQDSVLLVRGTLVALVTDITAVCSTSSQPTPFSSYARRRAEVTECQNLNNGGRALEVGGRGESACEACPELAGRLSGASSTGILIAMFM